MILAYQAFTRHEALQSTQNNGKPCQILTITTTTTTYIIDNKNDDSKEPQQLKNILNQQHQQCLPPHTSSQHPPNPSTNANPPWSSANHPSTAPQIPPYTGSTASSLLPNYTSSTSTPPPINPSDQARESPSPTASPSSSSGNPIPNPTFAPIIKELHFSTKKLENSKLSRRLFRLRNGG